MELWIMVHEINCEFISCACDMMSSRSCCGCGQAAKFKQSLHVDQAKVKCTLKVGTVDLATEQYKLIT